MMQYNWLLARLDAFIRKYYANQLLRGGLSLLICLLFFILTASISEYYLYLPSWLRVSLVSFFLIAGAASLFFWVLRPLAKMAKLGNVLSREKAAVIVGTHFPEIKDKLLNILQLHHNPSAANGSRELIEASINQKAAQLSVIPLTKAVDLGRNKKLLPVLLPLLLVGVFILVAAPNVFRDAGSRLMNPTKTFEKPAPFQFLLEEKNLRVARNGDYELNLRMAGNALPGEVSVVIGADEIPMKSLPKNNFQYTFRNVTDPVVFHFSAAGYSSKSYTLQVVQKPELKSFKVRIDYPEYTGRKDELRGNLGDMTLPAGTTVYWGVVADHTDGAMFQWKSGAAIPMPHTGNIFGYNHRFLSDTAYTISLRNSQSAASADFSYGVQIIPDQFPTIQVQQYRDTVSGNQILITGSAGDDYRVLRVLFHYNVVDAQNRSVSSKALVLNAAGGAVVPFQQYFDIGAMNLQPGQKINYYVEAWDNDGVHGSKAARSEVMTYATFSPKQIDSVMNQNADQINAGLSSSAQQNQQMQNDIQEAQNRMLQSNDMSSWDNKQNLQEMLEKQQQLQAKMQAAQKRFDDQVKQSENKPYSDDVRDKQDALKKQMDNTINKELAEQMKRLQELMQQMNKQDAVKTAQQMEEANKLFDMDLARMQELMKQLETQMRMEDIANKAEELAKKQDDLRKQTDAGAKDDAALKQAQQDLQKQLSDMMQKDMKGLEDINKSSDNPKDLNKAQDQGKDAGKQMQQSQQQLGSGSKSNSSKSQSKAAQNLQDMAQTLRQQASGMDIEQIEMDIRAVRQILTNLMRLSFEQEKLMKTVRATNAGSPAYLANQTEQERLHKNSRMIRDSMFVLSKRLAKLSTTVNKETTELESNMGRATSSLEGRMIGDALTRQQYVMTHTNNLALMLNEALSNLMQMQSDAKKPGAGSCSKPGGSNPKPGEGKSGKGAGGQLGDIITGQQQLGDAMQQAGQGKKPGQGQQPGGQSGQGSGQGGSGNGSENGGDYGDAQTLARLANQQAALRRQLQAVQSLLNSKGLGNAKDLRDIQDMMDRNEDDLVNRRFNAGFLNRQRDILTRLLQAEKSMRDQDQDDKRAAKNGENTARTIPPELQKYLLDRKNLLELYRTVPPQLKPYYKTMVEQYYRSINTR